MKKALETISENKEISAVVGFSALAAYALHKKTKPSTIGPSPRELSIDEIIYNANHLVFDIDNESGKSFMGAIGNTQIKALYSRKEEIKDNDYFLDLVIRRQHEIDLNQLKRDAYERARQKEIKKKPILAKLEDNIKYVGIKNQLKSGEALDYIQNEWDLGVLDGTDIDDETKSKLVSKISGPNSKDALKVISLLHHNNLLEFNNNAFSN